MHKEKVKKITPYISITLLLLALITVGVFLFFGLKGETKVVGQKADPKNNDFIICTISNFDYPFFTDNNATSKKATVKAVFNNNYLSSIYFEYQLTYATASEASANSGVNHANMNKSFGSTYGADAFNATYRVDNTEMRMNLYTEVDGLTENGRKYFLITNTNNSKKSLIENYKTQGFTCRNNN